MCPMGKSWERSVAEGLVAEDDVMAQVTCTVSSCSYLFQRPWFDECLRAVSTVRADRAWLPSVKSQSCELEAHCKIKVDYFFLSICSSSTQTPSLLSELEETFGYHIIFPVQTTDEESET